MQTVVTLSVALNVLAVLVLWEMVSTAQVRTYTVILLYACKVYDVYTLHLCASEVVYLFLNFKHFMLVL